MIYDIAVVGAGAAGTQAMLRAVLNNDSCLFFTGTKKDQKKSRAFWVSKVENMPAHFQYKKGIVQPLQEVVEFVRQSDFAEKLSMQENVGVEELKKNADGLFEIKDSLQKTHLARYVILCTGVMDVQPVIKGSIKPILPYANVQLADYCLRCDGHHVIHKNVGIIGTDTSSVWVAVMLVERYPVLSMTVFTHGKSLKLSDELLSLQKKYQITIVEESIEGFQGEAKENKLEALHLSDGKQVAVDIIFVSLGMIVYNQLAKGLGADLDERGFVKTNDKGMSTIEGLFIAGDLRANTKKQIYTAWDTAVDAADEINLRLRRMRRQ